MKQRKRRSPDDARLTARLTGVTVIGLVLLLPPLLSAFNRGGQIFGIPAVGLYLFVAWALIIVLVALLVRGSG